MSFCSSVSTMTSGASTSAQAREISATATSAIRAADMGASKVPVRRWVDSWCRGPIEQTGSTSATREQACLLRISRRGRGLRDRNTVRPARAIITSPEPTVRCCMMTHSWLPKLGSDHRLINLRLSGSADAPSTKVGGFGTLAQPQDPLYPSPELPPLP